jgi:hypothetical protein
MGILVVLGRGFLDDEWIPLLSLIVELRLVQN